MKQIILWLILSAITLLVFPWLSVTFTNECSGMLVNLILLFAIDPIYSICAGAYAGGDIKKFWFLPVVTALLFLIGTWLFFAMGETDFILYALVYLILGIIAMFISAFINKSIMRKKALR